MEYPSKKLLKKLLKQVKNRPHYYSHNNLLYNTGVLYFFVFLSALLILLFSDTQNISAVLVFFLTGFVVSFFTKNMTVVLFFASLISSIYGSILVFQTPYLGGNVFEGMEDNTDTSGNKVPVKKGMENLKKELENESKVMETDKKNTEKKDGFPEGSTVKKLMSEDDQLQKSVTSLLGQIGGGSTLGDGDSHSQQIERLKLQSNILDKINQLEPFMNSLAKITETYNGYSPGK